MVDVLENENAATLLAGRSATRSSADVMIIVCEIVDDFMKK
jgi:hypothetical protein